MKIKFSPSVLALTASAVMFCASPVSALDVQITKGKDYAEVVHSGSPFKIQRIQNTDNVLEGGFTKTSRVCPPFCIQPQHVAPGVNTIAELELLEFLEKQVKSGTGMVIDARTPGWHAKGTIPGSINIPFSIFEKKSTDDELVRAMHKLGVKRQPYVQPGMVQKVVNMAKNAMGMEIAPPSNWDFSNAKEIALWCNGMWCGQSPRAIRALLKHQYPAEKIHYYRGGMQSWSILGLSVTKPENTL